MKSLQIALVVATLLCLIHAAPPAKFKKAIEVAKAVEVARAAGINRGFPMAKAVAVAKDNGVKNAIASKNVTKVETQAANATQAETTTQTSNTTTVPTTTTPVPTTTKVASTTRIIDTTRVSSVTQVNNAPQVTNATSTEAPTTVGQPIKEEVTTKPSTPAAILVPIASILASSGEDSSGSSEEMPLNDQQLRFKLVDDMRDIEKDIEEDMFENDMLDVQEELMKLARLWPRIAALSQSIYSSLPEGAEKQAELQIQEALRQDLSRIHYKAKARKCQSADEAFYPPQNRCVIIGSLEPNSNPCSAKVNQVLHDTKDNTAVCDCIADERNLIYSGIDEKCHIQNTQGPCANGTWLTVVGDKTVCEQVPADCPADGQHVYHSQDPLVAKPQCYQVGAKGPCFEGSVLQRDSRGSVTCVAPTNQNESPVKLNPSCRAGSHRAQSGICPL